MSHPTTTPPTDPRRRTDPVRDSAPRNEPHDGGDGLNPPITANGMQGARTGSAGGTGGAGL